ncbi:MAG: ArnT family glycosyltransferase [Bdellovibrionales bacterium]
MGQWQMPKGVFWGILGTSFVLGLLLRIALVIQFVGLESPPDPGAQPDQLDYELYAYQMSRGEGYTKADGAIALNRPPGTSFTLVGIYYLAGRDFGLGRIWFCFLSALTILAVGWLGALSFGRMTGGLAAILLALFPNHAYFPLHFVSEVPFALLVIVGSGLTILALRSQDQNRRWRQQGSWFLACLAGVVWGFATLVRPNILLVIPLYWLVVFFLSQGNWIHLLRQMVILSLLSGLTLFPWVLRNRLVVGQWTISTVGAYTFWGAHNEKTLRELPGGWIGPSKLTDADHPFVGEDLADAALAWKYSLAFLRDHTEDLPYLVMMKIYRLVSPFEETENRIIYWVFALAWLVTVPFLIMGIWHGLIQNRDETIILLVPILALVVTAILFYGSCRFRDSIAPSYLLFAAVGLLWVVNWWRKGPNRERVTGRQTSAGPV